MAALIPASSDLHDFSNLSDLILEGSNLGTWTWNIQTGEAKFNDEWARIIGYTLDELGPLSINSWLDVIHPDDLEGCNLALQAHFCGETPLYTFEARMKHKQGHWVKVLDQGTVLIRDSKGEPLWMFGVHLDVSELWHKQIEIKQLKDRLELLASNLPGFVYQFLMDASGNITTPFATEKVQELFGCSAEELRSNTAAMMNQIDSDYIDHIYQTIEQSRINLSEWHETFKVNHPEKGSIWVEARSLPKRTKSGGTIWYGYAQDVTEQTNKLERIRLLSAVVDTTHQGVMVTDTNTVIQEVNHAFTNITGYSAKEACGQTPSFLSSGRCEEAFYENMWRDLKDKGHWKGTVWNRHKSGEVYPQLLTIDALKNSSGVVTNYIGAFTDISELIKEKELLLELANRDPLTNLPNRKIFNQELGQRLAHAKAANEHLMVLFMDLNKFKSLNDTYGHYEGDQYLAKVANVLSDRLSDQGLICRIGGDEFIGVRSVECCEACDKHILITNIKRDIQDISVIYPDLKLGISIGVACFPLDGQSTQRLIEVADERMYIDKHKTRH